MGPQARAAPGAISKKSYLLYWAILLAVAVCAAHYSYVTFQEYIVDYAQARGPRTHRHALPPFILQPLAGAP